MTRWGLIFWSLAALGGCWAILVSLLLDPRLQKHALYAHRFHTAWWHDISKPEIFGFAEGQVTPFRISTPDNESLYAWHILPMGIYGREAKALKEETRGELEAVQFQRSRAYELLRDPKSRLIINFHGNAGHVAQGWRTDTYKSLSTADGLRVHILTFDYRGFGTSTGEPSEAGLITDGIAIVNWALNVAQIPPQRIVLASQSLGTAVATAVAEHFATTQPALAFAGLFLCSGFSDIPNLMKTYAIGGVVPILSPLQPYPRLAQMISSRIVDTWNTAARLERLAALSPRLRLHIVHATNDFDIGWQHADILFDAAVTGLNANAKCLTPEASDVHFNSTEIWTQRVVTCKSPRSKDGGEWARRTLLRYGGGLCFATDFDFDVALADVLAGHNRAIASNYAAVAIRDMFDAAEKL